jgi:hypothetical protein
MNEDKSSTHGGRRRELTAAEKVEEAKKKVYHARQLVRRAVAVARKAEQKKSAREIKRLDDRAYVHVFADSKHRLVESSRHTPTCCFAVWTAMVRVVARCDFMHVLLAPVIWQVRLHVRLHVHLA